MSTSAVMVFARESDIDGAWKWGECTCFLPRVSKYYGGRARGGYPLPLAAAYRSR